MRDSRFRFWVFGLVMATALVAAQGATSIPEVLYGDGPEPVWVSAEAAVDNSGGINWALLPAAAKRTYESVVMNDGWAGKLSSFAPEMAGVRSDCLNYGSSDYDLATPPSRSSLGALVKDSQEVFRGRVEAVSQGFQGGSIGTLLAVRVFQNFGRGGEGGPKKALVMYPSTRFAVAGLGFCKYQPGFERLPEIGDHLFFFAHTQSSLQDPPFYALGSGDLVLYSTNEGIPARPVLFLEPPFDFPSGAEDFARRIELAIGRIESPSIVQSAFSMWTQCGNAGIDFPKPIDNLTGHHNVTTSAMASRWPRRM